VFAKVVSAKRSEATDQASSVAQEGLPHRALADKAGVAHNPCSRPEDAVIVTRPVTNHTQYGEEGFVFPRIAQSEPVSQASSAAAYRRLRYFQRLVAIGIMLSMFAPAAVGYAAATSASSGIRASGHVITSIHPTGNCPGAPTPC
jgi:hypothetical protein